MYRENCVEKLQIIKLFSTGKLTQSHYSNVNGKQSLAMLIPNLYEICSPWYERMTICEAWPTRINILVTSQMVIYVCFVESQYQTRSWKHAVTERNCLDLFIQMTIWAQNTPKKHRAISTDNIPLNFLIEAKCNFHSQRYRNGRISEILPKNRPNGNTNSHYNSLEFRLQV